MAEFPETTFGLLCGVRKTGPEERRAGMDTLCRRYWEPIRSYARAAWARSDEDANDLTQDFFMWILEGDVLERFAPERGSFRHYLKGLLRNFSRNAAQAARSAKRGGGRAGLSLDAEGAPEIADDRLQAAEEAFERAWVVDVTSRAIDRVRTRLAEGPRAAQWRVFESYDLAPERPTYLSVAQTIGIKESDVRNALYAVREKVRDAIRTELCETVATKRDLDAELRRFVGA
jgi:RNA polymerase sigma-70 factor (ECF subfamily)